MLTKLKGRQQLVGNIIGSPNLHQESIKNSSVISSVCPFSPTTSYDVILISIPGWLCVIAWQTGMAGTAFAVAQQLQGLIALNMPSYAIQGWHGTLLSIAIVVCSILGNTVLVTKLPMMEGIALVLHVFGFFAFLVVLWVMGPRSNVHDTWTKFEDPSGWGSTGLATLVGILGPILSLGGADLAIHLAEEVEEASFTVPRAMIATSAVNYTLAFIMTVTVFSTLGDDVMALMSTPLGQPWIQILLNATGSIAATNILTVVICLLLLFCSVNQVTAASRQLWSFARDKGLPFSGWLSYVRRPLTMSILALKLCIGPSRMGYSRECGIVYTAILVSFIAHHCRLIHRLQHYSFTWRR